MVQIKSILGNLWKYPLLLFEQVLPQGINRADDHPYPHPQERGSVVVLVTLALTVLLGFCAIVTDVGLLYAEKAHLQNSVDAAALAGVQELTSNTTLAATLAAQTASAYATQNGVSAVTVTIEEDNTKIIVQATQQVPTYFARIWGITEEQISVSARAMMVPPAELSGAVPSAGLSGAVPPAGLSRAVPLSIQEQVFVCGLEYVLKSGGRPEDSDLYLNDDKNNAVKKSVEEPGTPGWYGALELSGTGADNYATDLAYGYQGTLRVGQIVSVKHGNMSGPTAVGINTRLGSDTREPPNTFAVHDRDAPQIVYIPIVRIITESGNSIQEVQIVGFAAFFLEGVKDSEVTGRFIQTHASNGETSNDFGLYTPKLVAN